MSGTIFQPQLTAPTRERMVYTKFTDSVVGAMSLFTIHCEHGGSTRVITTLSAGWPLVFLNNRATFCTAIERNPAQIAYIRNKYTSNDPHMAFFGQQLINSSEIIAADFMDVPGSYWLGRVAGGEFIFLSNIWDHAKREGREVSYMQSISNILATEGSRGVRLVSTSFSQSGLDSFQETAANVFGNEYPFRAYPYTAPETAKGPLKDFRVLEFV